MHLNIFITLLQPNSNQTVWSTHYKPHDSCTTFHDLGRHDMISTVSETFQMMPISPFCFSEALFYLLIQWLKTHTHTHTHTQTESVPARTALEIGDWILAFLYLGDLVCCQRSCSSWKLNYCISEGNDC